MITLTHPVTYPHPLRILQIASGDLWAGAEVQLFNLACELNQIGGSELLVVLLNPGLLEQRLKEHGVKVVVFNENQLSSLRILLNLIKLIRHYRPHIVHTHRQKENVLGAVASLFCAQAKSVRTVHGAPEFVVKPWQIPKSLFPVMDRLCARFLQSRIICVSETLIKIFNNIPRKKLAIIENGINIEHVINQSQNRITLPGPPGRIKIAFVGRLVPVKRLDIFLEIARLLSRSHSGRFSFYILGDGPMASYARQFIAQHKLGHEVFLLGFVPNLPAYLIAMDMLCITSDHEGLPMMVLEALALKVPILSHSIGAIPSVLADGRCGTLISSQNPADYAAVIEGLLVDDVEIRTKALAGFEWVKSGYSSYRNAQNYLDSYLQVLTNSG